MCCQIGTLVFELFTGRQAVTFLRLADRNHGMRHDQSRPPRPTVNDPSGGGSPSLSRLRVPLPLFLRFRRKRPCMEPMTSLH